MFGAVKFTKNFDIDECRYSGFGIGFVRKGEFSFGDGFGRNCIMFGVDTSSSVHVDSKKRISKFLVNGLPRIRWHKKYCRKKKYLINFTENNRFCLSLHYNRANCYLFVNGTEIHKFKEVWSQL